MYKYLLILFILLSFITHPIAEYGSHPIFGRIVYSDVFGGLALLVGISKIIDGFVISNIFSPIYFFAIVLLLSFLLPIAFSLNIPSSLVENLIILFLIFISILLFYTFKDELFTSFIPIIINTIIITSLFGFYDLVASMYGFPRIFPVRTESELISGFRNAGQAGAYYLVFLTMLIPLNFSRLKDKLSKKYKKRLKLALIISIIFLAATGKIAAYIGILIGVFLFFLANRDFKNLISFSFMFLILLTFYQNLDSIAPNLANRLESRYRTRVTENIEGTSQNNFFESNWGGAIEAFFDHPFTGTGLGAYYGTYGNYEVHSTYLKMIGETGVIGTIGYILFMLAFLSLFFIPKNYDIKNPYNDYLLKMLPFIIGCLVSWSYTFHLRKREFWILVALVIIVHYHAKLYNLSENNANANEEIK